MVSLNRIVVVDVSGDGKLDITVLMKLLSTMFHLPSRRLFLLLNDIAGSSLPFLHEKMGTSTMAIRENKVDLFVFI